MHELKKDMPYFMDIALAEGIAGNENDFVRLMNGRARELGLSKSNFTNPTGLPDPDMRVTVRELGKLAPPRQQFECLSRDFTFVAKRQRLLHGCAPGRSQWGRRRGG